MTNTFISCDWGTSRFRLRLVDERDGSVLKTITTADGIGALYQPFKTADERRDGYLLFLRKQVCQLNADKSVPVVISGMASSSIGIRELPYAPLPFALSGDDMIAEWLPVSGVYKHDVLLLSGVRSHNDVMRGEETQLVGLHQLLAQQQTEDRIYVFPGTHSKHMFVRGGVMQDFKTYMTGELFQLLCTHSLLKDDVTQSQRGFEQEEAEEAFAAGVAASGETHLLNALFITRTNRLLRRFTPEANYHYLSGVLIGSELHNLIDAGTGIMICAEGQLATLYGTAMQLLHLDSKNAIVSGTLVSEATVKGQLAILKKMNQP